MNSSWHAAFQYPMHLFKRYSIWCACVLSGISSGRLFETPWTEAHQAPLSMGFSRQESWSWLPFPSPEDLPHPKIETTSLTSPASEAGSLPLVPPRKPPQHLMHLHKSQGRLCHLGISSCYSLYLSDVETEPQWSRCLTQAQWWWFWIRSLCLIQHTSGHFLGLDGTQENPHVIWGCFGREREVHKGHYPTITLTLIQAKRF